MPSLYNIDGYKIYFWSNENNEPVHIHICKGTPTSNATKYWITQKGKLLKCNNKSRIPSNELNKIIRILENNISNITTAWLKYFGYISYYC